MTGQSRGFTLLELMVVVAIIALGTAAASLALRDSRGDALMRDAERLAALLEAARAQSRTTGTPVFWRAQGQGFVFEGLPPSATPLPTHWLDAATQADARPPLQLGPEPVIGAQSVVLRQAALAGDRQPARRLRVSTDGLRPFAVEALP